MPVLVVTTWFPTAASPSTGVFVARDVAAIAERHEVVVLHLVAPHLADWADRLGKGGEDGQGGEGGQAGRAVQEAPGLRGGAGGAELPGGIPVEQLVMDPRRPDHLVRAARRIADLERGADLVHTMAVSALLPFAGRRPDRPWVHTEHWSGLGAPQTLSAPLRLARHAVRPLLALPDVVAVVGPDLAREVRRLRSGPVRVVPNIVTTPPVLQPRREPAAGLRERGPLRLVAAGGLIPRKDPVTAVRATAELRERGIDARLTWVGEGVLRDEVERDAGAHDTPLGLPGALPPGQVQQVVGEGDVFLLPTRAETFCLAAAEALAAGRPVVVGDVSGPREFVGPPSGALVAPGATPSAWADAVEKVWAASAGLAAEEVAAPVVERFGREAYANRVEHVYAEVADRRAGRGGRSRPDGGSRRPPRSRPDGAAAPRPVDGEGAGSRRPDSPPAPVVDVVVAVHSTRRQVARAVRSVLDGSGDLPVRVSVVAHNLSAADSAGLLPADLRGDPRVRVMEVSDGIPSPSGPFNAGIEAASAPWVSIMGSDDALAPGALPGWLEAAAGRDPDEPVVVLPPVRLAGRPLPTPPARPVRGRGRVELVRDRLSYRSAPLGLISRGALRLPGARLHPGARVGEDLPMMTALYAGSEVLLATRAPAYLVHDDAPDRITADPRPLRDQLLTADALWDLPWMARLTSAQRRAVGTKVLRIQVFGAILTRPDPTWWTPQERDELARVTRRVLDAAPGCAGPLSLADHDLLAAALDPQVPVTRLLSLARSRRRHGTPRTLLPGDWRHALDPEAPLRLMAASLWASRPRFRP